MSMQRLGKAYIKVDGELLETDKGAKINLGGYERKTIVGNNAVHGYAEEPKESTLECTISVGPDTDLTRFSKITDATITFEADTGQTWIIRNAWVTDTLECTDGDGGKVPLKFAGPPAEEMA